MPSPSPEALRAAALTALDSAYAARHASHFLGFVAGRAEPQIPQQLLDQRRVILKLSSNLVTSEFEKEMDELCSAWLAYREATK